MDNALTSARGPSTFWLVGSLRGIPFGQFHGVAGIAYILETDTFYRAAIFNIEAGNNAFG